MATIKENKIGRIIAMRLGPDEDLLQGILNICRKYGFENAVLLSGIGSLKQVHVFNEVPVSVSGGEIIYGYDSEPKIWGGRQGVLELCSLKGTVSTKEDGTRESWLHITFSNAAGTVLGGRLAEGTLVKLTSEIIIGELL
jgi:predicted DNA-binding protein with PD1-like motif